MEQSVPKRWHIKFRHRGITHNKAYSITLLLFSCCSLGAFLFIKQWRNKNWTIFYRSDTWSNILSNRCSQTWLLSNSCMRVFFNFFFFRSCTVHLDTIKVSNLPTDAQENCFKSNIKFTLIIWRLMATIWVVRHS